MRRLLIALAVMSLAACSSNPGPVTTPPVVDVSGPITFNGLGPVIDDRSVTMATDPHVERLMPVDLNGAVKGWIVSRLRSTGVGGNTVRVVIKDTSVIEKASPKETGLKALVTDQIEADYVASVDVEVVIQDASGAMIAHSQARLSHTRQMFQRASLDERKTLWTALVNDLVQDLDQSLSKEIRSSLAAWIINR